MLGLQPDEQVLDVGCGIGGGDFYLAKTYGCYVYGIDLSVNAILTALERAAAMGNHLKVRSTDFTLPLLCLWDRPLGQCHPHSAGPSGGHGQPPQDVRQILLSWCNAVDTHLTVHRCPLRSAPASSVTSPHG